MSRAVLAGALSAALASVTLASCGEGDASGTPDGGADSGADGDADTDSDGGVHAPMIDCASGEGKLDPDTGLCWQEPPSLEVLTWYQACGEEDPTYNPGGSTDYCGDLVLGGFADWRLPDIDELRSLVRGCPETEPGGVCRVTVGSDWTDWSDDCNGCSWSGGPGLYGCYWDPALSGLCDDWYWSSSACPEHDSHAWHLLFSCGYVVSYSKASGKYIRCVRGGS